MTLISIVLPTYNGSQYITRAIESVISQSFNDWELIIVNDCSTDNTLEIINEWKEKDARIKIINNEVNKKLPASLNVGFLFAQGKYYTWTSDDNMYKPDALKTMFNFLEEHEDIDFISCDMDWVNENLEKFALHSDFAQRKSPLTLSYICNVGACFMYRSFLSEIIGPYDENLFCAEDYDYWCRIALSRKMAYIENNCYTYVTNTNGLSFTQRERADQMAEVVVKKYARSIIEKYTKNTIEKAFAYSRVKNKYKNFSNVSLYNKISMFIFFDIPRFIIRFIPNKKIRHMLKNKMYGQKL